MPPPPTEMLVLRQLVKNTDVAGQPSVLAEALVSAERPQDSIGIFATMGDETSAVEMALRTGSWDWLQSNGPEDLALAAGYLRQIPEFSTESLSPNGDLIDTSRALRENIDVLLNSTVEAGN